MIDRPTFTVLAQNPQNTKQLSNASFYLLVAGGIAGLLNMSQPVPFGKGYEMVQLANFLASHGQFANPFGAGLTGPTGAYPPVYPFFLALIIRIFKVEPLILLAVSAANMIVNALIASWLPRISMIFFKSIWPGTAAGILWLAIAQLMPDWDASYTLALLLVFCIYSAATIDRPKNIWLALLAGLLGAVLLLLNTSSVLVFFPWVLFLILNSATDRRRAVIYALTVLLVVSMAGFTWMMRNRMSVGVFGIKTNLGMALYVSNNDCAQASLIADEKNNCHQQHHPNTNPEEAALVRKMGEGSYDRLRETDAKKWIAEHPGRFMHLTFERFVEFWFPPINEHPWKMSVLWLATLLSVPGLLMMAKKRLAVTIYVACVLLIYPIMYYIVVSDVRYRYPILWLTLLPAGYFLHWIFANFLHGINHRAESDQPSAEMPLP
ncbi:MAG TPA: hypothetical protein VG844_11640 [Terracidiphilus sp.]|nr:hypothetical protein [Terracidiphilus sp.]